MVFALSTGQQGHQDTFLVAEARPKGLFPPFYLGAVPVCLVSIGCYQLLVSSGNWASQEPAFFLATEALLLGTWV